MSEIKANNKKSFSELLKQKNTIYLVVILVMIAIIGILWIGIVGAGSKALHEKYEESFATEKEVTYQKLYRKFFERAEREYHVKNRVAISIGDIAEVANLEVLKVSDIEYVIKDSGQDNITSWLEVPGEGTYTINLQEAEFIVDEERAYVLVRAPYPEITNITIVYKDVEKLLFKNDIFNESRKVGEDLAREQLTSADLLIKKEFASNQLFYINAQEAGRTMIECMIKQFNPNIPELTVGVEFF